MPIPPELVHHVYPGPMRAFLYGRASSDPRKKGRSVKAQIDEGCALCAAVNWPVVGVFDKDVDRSATRHARKPRADFAAMLEGIEAGLCRVVVAWEASRYYRDLEVYVRLRNVCAANGVLLCYNGMVYDLSKREDRRATAQDALQAEDEGEGIRDRNLRTARSKARAGQPHGRLLFGYARRYDPDTGELIEQYAHPVQGPKVTKIFLRVASYHSLESVARAFGLTVSRLRKMLRNPAYRGRRVFRGKDIGKAKWPALVDDETWYTVQRILDAPGRRTSSDCRAKYLLSCIALCGECLPELVPLDKLDEPFEDSPYLKAAPAQGKGVFYRCQVAQDTVILKEKLDAYVEEAVLEWLSSGAAVEAFRPEGTSIAIAQAQSRLEQLQQQLDEARQAAARFTADGTPQLSVASLVTIEADLAPQIATARAEIETVAMPPLLRGLVGRSDIEAAWEALDIAQRRQVVRTIVTVRLFHARAKGVKAIEPGRVTLSFVGQPGFLQKQKRPAVRGG